MLHQKAGSRQVIEIHGSIARGLASVVTGQMMA